MSRDKEEWKVGDRVQKTEYKDGMETYHTGVISAVETATREKSRYSSYGYYSRTAVPETKTYVNKISVKWDDGKEESDLSTWSVVPEDTEYERAFRKAVPEAQRRIEEKLALATKYLREAVDISEETGIPFDTSISFLSQSYRPGSTGDKFPEVDSEFVKEVTECYNEYEGWEHSAVC